MLKFDESVGTVYPGTMMGILIMKAVSYSRPYPEEEIASFLNELDKKYCSQFMRHPELTKII